MNSIILIGMPGCGKTTIGKKLAKNLGFDFVDCDQYIEDTLNTTIPQIFEQYGEEYFRAQETAALKKLSNKIKTVISTGGGVVERRDNIDILQSSDIVVFINRPIEKILEDVDTSKRPLLKGGKDKLFELYQRRLGLYKEACSIEVLNNTSIENAVLKILNEVTKND